MELVSLFETSPNYYSITRYHIPGYGTTVLILQPGRAIAQAVSGRLPTAAARVQTRVWSCGIL
jgi:hypothetical protein